MTTLNELTGGLSTALVAAAKQGPVLGTDDILLLGQRIFEAKVQAQEKILIYEQSIEERESDIIVAIIDNKELTNDMKRKVAKQKLEAEDAVLLQLKEEKRQVEQRLAAIEFVASQYRDLVRLLSHSN